MAIADDDSTKKLVYTDDELLVFVREERRRSIGFGEGDSGELTAARETALAYYKGDMINVPAEWRVPSLENRSKAVDTTVAEAAETLLPDIIEVFVGGDDVATFIPNGEQDEQQARDESDYLNHIVFVENPGFLNLYTAFKDAILVRTGILHFYPQVCQDEQPIGNVPAELAKAAEAAAEAQGMDLETEDQPDGSVQLVQTVTRLKVCISAVPPEDFSVAPDTVTLKDATYCVMRDRPRVQDLIARGVDAEVARALKTYTFRNDRVELERDEAGEHDKPIDGTFGDLRIVEVRAHYLRIDADGDGEPEIWRIVTDAEEQTFIEKEQVPLIPFAALTPYIIPHRFYGESVADKLLQVQQIKTAVTRMLLDAGYFAQNQRHLVAMDLASEFTLSDLLRNVPGAPVRARQPGAVTPIPPAPLGFDPLAALEYAATMAENRSGVVRNAQGLNPDTLHDTASGAMALISAAQKRVRMIARIFAETGIKDLYLGVHAMLRASFEDGYQPMNARLGSAWKQLKPSDWPEREAMAIHVGVGSGGRDHDLIVANQRLQLMQAVIQQPGAQGTLIDGPNIHAALMSWERAAGAKDGDQYWTDPSSPQAQQAAQAHAQQPNPEMQKVQGQLQLQQQEAAAKQQQAQQQMQLDAQVRQQQAAADAQLEAARAAADERAETVKADREHQLAVMRHQSEMQLAREKLAGELQLKREQIAAELQMKRELGQMQIHSQHEQGMAKVEAQAQDQVHVGGEPG